MPAEPEPESDGLRLFGGPEPEPTLGASDDEDSSSGYFTADEDVVDYPVPSTDMVLDYGLGCKGQCVIGGRWVDTTARTRRELRQFEPTDQVGWGQPSPREVEPLTENEVADQGQLARLVDEAGYRTLPADVQLGYLRDFYGPASRGAFGCKPEEAYEKTAELIRSCVKWRLEIDAEGLASAPLSEREKLFRELAPADVGPEHGTDAWGHPRMWCRVTGWPAIAPAVRKNFSAEELCHFQCKRFLEFQHKKRIESARLGRTVILHCVVLAFTPEDDVSLSNAKWLSAALQYEGRNIEQEFFPMSLNAPALIVNTPWKFRAAWNIAKKFMMAETAAKFMVLGSDFLPELKKRGVPYHQIPEWLVRLAKKQIKW